MVSYFTGLCVKMTYRGLIKFIIFRTRIPTLDSNLDELDDLEESRVDDVS